jgi:hypothetical protein
MADINHVISLGIGSPADIPHLTLFGLSPNATPPATVDPYAIVITVAAETRTITVAADDRTILVPDKDGHL